MRNTSCRSVYTDRVTASLLSVLERMQAPEGIAAGVTGLVRMLKVVLLAAVSAVVGLLLLLSIYRKQQVQQKRRAFRYAGECVGGSGIAAVTATNSSDSIHPHLEIGHQNHHMIQTLYALRCVAMPCTCPTTGCCCCKAPTPIVLPICSADWPHGCRVHAYVGSTATLLLLLWLISAGLACVLFFAATGGGVALVGDMAASRAFR